ncbi:type II secretion system protein GspM, partial [Patulibacter sp. S7RM1-6]
MSVRARTALAGLGVLVLAVLLWLLLVAPARQDVASARDARDAAEAREAQVTAGLARARVAARRAPGNARR